MSVKLGGKFTVIVYGINGEEISTLYDQQNTLLNNAYSYLMTGITPKLECGSSTEDTDKSGTGVYEPHIPSTEITSEDYGTQGYVNGNTVSLTGSTAFTFTSGEEFVLGELAIADFARAVLEEPMIVPENSEVEVIYEFDLSLTFNASSLMFGDTEYEVILVVEEKESLAYREWNILLKDYSTITAAVEHPTDEPQLKSTRIDYTVSNGVVTVWDLNRSINPVSFDQGKDRLDIVESITIEDPGFIVHYQFKDKDGKGVPVKASERIGFTETFTLDLED